MNKIDFGKNCSLTRYLLDVSMEDNGGHKAILAGAFIYELGYPLFKPQFLDITFIQDLVNHILKVGQKELLSQAKEKCVHCQQADSCEVGALIKVS